MTVHPFTPDPRVPADPYSGRGVCAWPLCGLPESNRVHALPDRPAEADARELAAGVEPEGESG